MVSCIFHALYICFCVVSYFEGMFKRYHSDQRVLGGREDVSHVMLLARCYEDAANKVAYEYIVDSSFIIIFRKYHSFYAGRIILFCVFIRHTLKAGP